MLRFPRLRPDLRLLKSPFWLRQLMLRLTPAVHHRGQLSSYLRPMGARVPSIYGPSGDDPGCECTISSESMDGDSLVSPIVPQGAGGRSVRRNQTQQ